MNQKNPHVAGAVRQCTNNPASSFLRFGGKHNIRLYERQQQSQIAGIGHVDVRIDLGPAILQQPTDPLENFLHREGVSGARRLAGSQQSLPGLPSVLMKTNTAKMSPNSMPPAIRQFRQKPEADARSWARTSRLIWSMLARVDIAALCSLAKYSDPRSIGGDFVIGTVETRASLAARTVAES